MITHHFCTVRYSYKFVLFVEKKHFFDGLSKGFKRNMLLNLLRSNEK